MLITRNRDIQQIHEKLSLFPVVALLGPRQCGKTTLARQILFDHYFDLEDPRDLAQLESPQLALEPLKGLIVIDEIQRVPELFPLLRVLVDRHPSQKYLILGSASRNLIRQSSESLTGRIGHHYLAGLTLEDVGIETQETLWMRGGFPRSILQDTLVKSLQWRREYITTFLERDIPQLGISIPAQTLRRFWTMLGHYHGQTINFSEIGRAFGMSDKTIRSYLDILSGTFMIRLLLPWFTNVGKRLIKRPKLYIRDSGLFHSLMSIDTINDLRSHPKLGASWEGFSLEAACRHIEQQGQPVYFWRTHSGAEVDLFWQHAGKNLAIEFKYMDAPRRTRSMQSALEDLNLAHLWIIYPGTITYRLSEKITVCPLSVFLESSAME